jgi:anti-sigma factor RsiW
MRCDDVMVNLPDFLLGKIEPNLGKGIQAHLDACQRCSAELEEMREPIRVLGEVGYEEYPDAFWQQLHASIMEKTSKPSAVRWKVPVYAGAIAVLLVFVGVGIFELVREPASSHVGTIAALATSLPPEQAVTLPSMNMNYVDAVSSQANELDEMDAVDDSVQQAVVSALWTEIGDSTSSVDAINYIGNNFSN